MRRLTTVVFLALLWAGLVFGQEASESTMTTAPSEPNTVVDFRASRWGTEAYSVLDASWLVGRRWEPRVVFWEFFSPEVGRQEKKVAVGVGYRIVNHENLVVVQEVLVSRAWTREGEKTLFLQPTTRAFFSHGKLSLELAGFPYVPIAGQGNLEWVLEKGRAGYQVTPFLSFSGGWGATEVPGSWVQGAVFGATFTPKHGKFGSWELAYQGGLQLHVIASGRPHLHHKKKK